MVVRIIIAAAAASISADCPVVVRGRRRRLLLLFLPSFDESRERVVKGINYALLILRERADGRRTDGVERERE